MKGSSALLVLILAVLCGSLYISLTNYKQIKELNASNMTLSMKVDSLQQMINKKPVQPQTAPAVKEKSTGSAFLDFLMQLVEENEAEAAREPIQVTTKYRLEDRYDIINVRKPELVGNQTGEVILNICVDCSGTVKSAKLKQADGITDEDVIEACKKAALQSRFNSDLDKDKQYGTITYIFSAK